MSEGLVNYKAKLLQDKEAEEGKVKTVAEASLMTKTSSMTNNE